MPAPRFKNKNCPECGKDFEPHADNQVTCGSRICKKQRSSRMKRERMTGQPIKEKVVSVDYRFSRNDYRSLNDRAVMSTIPPFVEPDRCVSCGSVFREGQTRYSTALGEVHGGCRE